MIDSVFIEKRGDTIKHIAYQFHALITNSTHVILNINSFRNFIQYRK